MAQVIQLSKAVTINGQEYPKGEKLKVSEELAEKLISEGDGTVTYELKKPSR